MFWSEGGRSGPAEVGEGRPPFSVSKHGNNVAFKSPSGTTHSRNTTFIYTETTAPQSAPKAQLTRAEDEEIRI